MDSLSSTSRRRTWASRSRRWSNLEEVESHCSSFSDSLADDDDDVFADGNTDFMLQHHGLEPCLQNGSLWSLDSTLNSGDVTFKMRLAMHAASTEMDNGVTSNVPEVLQSRSEDAEEILWQLGFGHEEQELTVRIPPRFLSFPSQARGINFRLFLDSQVRRIREEDPSFCIASRFRQVQALTAMANAFCSLYSHVSRTPLRKLGAPQFTFTVSSPAENVRGSPKSSVKSELRSPVERLKDTVSNMCLYTSTRKKSSLAEITTKTEDSGDRRQTHRGEEYNSVASEVAQLSDSKQIHCDLTEGDLKPLAIVTHELIHPKIDEHDQQANILHQVFSNMDSKEFGVQNKFTKSAARPRLVQTYAKSSEDCQHSDGFDLKNYKTLSLEEVYSTVEEITERGTPTMQHKGEICRGNSTQSDSSGFTDEDT
ncbi:protein TESPA1-like [Corythoichthys intestinalis]|uniref:protein TESPA1-like n=1 Tax=Corythoichthys intestinalis TaxID=161448 RepID=UPI0025A612A5|nr:protein TESPA1-like [Corythoichthys intestinalis]XP_057702246.1 protein TESPA1-like [Corythoichthys intestinalis]XP_057702247.1 protein TESPA1-like [Corythoichthys intestinalis]XP_057702248.1 protein TESPA1-like [Corythoichthys intestinalis]XP_057702249.1 protein TESPA1-like [Corythoichthys intestinalis]